jgi:hypothetical protein
VALLQCMSSLFRPMRVHGFGVVLRWDRRDNIPTRVQAVVEVRSDVRPSVEREPFRDSLLRTHTRAIIARRLWSGQK